MPWRTAFCSPAATNAEPCAPFRLCLTTRPPKLTRYKTIGAMQKNAQATLTIANLNYTEPDLRAEV